MASARSKTCAMVAVGRSSASSLPAPLMRHGLVRRRSSSTAVCRMPLQQAVRLGDRGRAGRLQALGSPGANGGRGDLVQVLAAEGRQDVPAQQTSVPVDRGRGQAALLHPTQGVLLEVERACIRVVPGVALDVGADEVEPVLGVGPGLERLRCGVPLAVGAWNLHPRRHISRSEAMSPSKRHRFPS